MKRLLTLLVALIGMTSAWSQTLRRGDLNGDGEITLADLTQLASILENRHHEYVDLGLPSGTLWATTNIGADFPEEYGEYFAWGETEPKSDYSWETYKWCEGTGTTLTKYCTDEAYGQVDSLRTLDMEDDVAYVMWGPDWRMPTDDELYELRSDAGLVTLDFDASVNGVGGVRLTSKANGNSIFLPYAGYKVGSDVVGKGFYATIRNSFLRDGDPPQMSGFRWWRHNSSLTFDGTRCYGTSIRPVRARKTPSLE